VQAINALLQEEKIPSLAILIKIARVLGVRPGTFLDDNEHTGPVYTKKIESNQAVSFSSQLTETNSHLDFFALAGNKAGRHMEPFVISIKASTDSEPSLSSHEGEEFLYVLEGEIKVVYGKETYYLAKGESLYYDSVVDHMVSAVNSDAKIIAVVYTPF
jgi:mannose-6-phosphate isomerase-like protein (cupin superfamily)